MKIYLDTVGCRLNQAEIESMALQLRVAGHEIVASANMADMAVVNTCAVTNDAASESRSKIRQIGRAGVNEIIATGCWATLQPKEAAALPNVLQVVSNANCVKEDFHNSLPTPSAALAVRQGHPTEHSRLHHHKIIEGDVYARL